MQKVRDYNRGHENKFANSVTGIFRLPPFSNTGVGESIASSLTNRIRNGGESRELAMPKRDAAFRQIVGRKLQGDFVSGQNTDSVATESTSQMG